MKQLLLCVALFACTGLLAQHSIKLSIKDSETRTPLSGATATISSLHITTVADSAGLATFSDIASGTYLITISHVGFKEQDVTITFPQTSGVTDVLLPEEEDDEHEVVVTSTRTSRTISDIPTRVETISGEELAEKGNMKPGDIRMLLNESTGIQTQQTSATSYNSSIRIQGLDGRYTQLLRDGFPLYAGFAGGLSLMQVAPLDLKQIEVIKGSSSTLYGGGSIAGLVNLISKIPVSKRELRFLGNGTSAGGLDLSGFYSQKFKKTGITVFGSRNTGRPYDPAHLGLTAIPQFSRYTFNPRFFLYANKTTADIGFSYISENRVGGSMDYIKKEIPGYFEKNNTDRFTTQAQLTRQWNDQARFTVKNSYSRFNRLIEIPGYLFKGTQQSTYSEATYSRSREKSDWVIGANFLTDDFKEDRQNSSSTLRNYHYSTLGGFIQNTLTPATFFSLETGLRGDYVWPFGWALLPRVSALLKLPSGITARLGGGLGYKTPTVFNEEAEKIQFRHILPIDQNTAFNERSAGASFDVNYRARLGAVGLALNQLFFYTRLNRPLVLIRQAGNDLQFENASGHLDTRGLETNLRLTYRDVKLFLGYTYADVNTHFNQVKSWFPLTARHRLNNVLMYEQEGRLKIGVEAYYFSPQKLSDGNMGKSYWTFGFMGEKYWKLFSLFINLENITDTRQTKFDSIYTGNITNPVFRDIYAPLDGFVLNGGIKLGL
ncbi:MAG: TonB-dependent receptor plug domain-containing protein [Williamsia sp.]|nr:TonB-dependent receptor plug domain-containing protein [Williamsia sp.]